jgi:hypothetical protein
LHWFSATPERLFLSVMPASANAPKNILNTYDWSFRRVSSRELQIAVDEVAVVRGNEYILGVPSTPSLLFSRQLYRLHPDGRTTLLRENVEDITAVTP